MSFPLNFEEPLYEHFFKTYNEKLWGVPVNELPADFAAQRIKSLSLWIAVTNAVLTRRNQKNITSLIEEFQYPKYGPGMMWEAAAARIESRGGRVVLGEKVRTVHWEAGHDVAGLTTLVTGGYAAGAGAPAGQRTDVGTERHYPLNECIGSMPLGSLIRALDPKPPVKVL